MTTNQILEEARAKLDGGKSEVIVDFSPVSRLDAAELRALENLAAAAQKKSIKLALCGVGVGVYKVLKLSKAAVWADLRSA